MDDAPFSDFSAPPARGRGVVLALALGIGLFGAYAIFGPKPWQPGLDTSPEVKEGTRIHSWAIIGVWWAATINAGLLTVALAAFRFRPRQWIDPGPAEPPKIGIGGTWWIAVLAATGLSAFLMAPRLGLSLWGDEEATVRRFLFGNFYRNEDGSWFVKTPRWERTLWGYDAGPNNQVLFSVLARLSHGPPDTTGENPSAFYFSGAKIRFPSYLATVLTIPAAACLLAVLGFARGAPAMAFALALHPWIIRHGSDARGYGLMMLLGVCCVLSLAMALRGRRSPVWWIANGLSQFLLLYAHLGGIYLLFPLNLAAFWTLWAPFSTPGRRNPFRIADLWRLGGACLIGASVFLQAMLPNLLQLPRWLAGGRLTGKTDPDVLKNWPFDWAFGTPLMSWDEANPNALTVHDLFSRSPISTAAVAGLSGVLLILGIHALWQKADRGRLWALALLLPAPLMFADAFRSSKILYPWYTVGYLPLAWIVVGAGFACLFDRFSRQRFLTPVLTMGWVAAFALATAPQRNLVREKSVEPLAESVRVTREVVNPFHPRIGEVLTVELVHATALYDPTMRRIKSDDDFVAALREADREGKPLFVNAANLGIGRPIYPKAFALIEDPAVFEEPIVLHGLQNPCTRYVFRYRPGGLSRHGTK